jgi:uncharacterized pyridoxamine 5'-phosphate oxidase family protein/NAD-dependent dihydropyrimidine dehydrogenase PreA subunit
MDLATCLEKLRLVGVLAFATVGEDGGPRVRNISAIHYEPDALYFFTARGKDFCAELLRDGRVQVLGYTRYKEMIRLTGRARPVPEPERARWMDVIFEEQPYLANLYPGSTRSIGVIFEIRSGEVEYFNLGVKPIFRYSFSLGDGTIRPSGYRITSACTGCGACAAVCPQGCIEPGATYRIQQEHCLRCGNCQKHCPAGAIRPRGEEAS